MRNGRNKYGAADWRRRLNTPIAWAIALFAPHPRNFGNNLSFFFHIYNLWDIQYILEWILV